MWFATIAVWNLVASPALAGAVQVGVEGMTCGVGCPPRIKSALSAIDGVENVVVDFGQAQACFEASSTPSEASLKAALESEGYSLGAIEAVDRCVQPVKVSPGDPWAKADGHDVKVISDGFEFAIKEHLVEGKFTIFDFGASWCGPCHVATRRIKATMANHPDLAVRAISLGDDPAKSFDFPVVQQHMAFADGLPWFILYTPQGKRVYEGGDVEALLKTLERKRK